MGSWTPIGNSSSKAFAGTFNGNGHAVSNLYINKPRDDSALFGITSNLLKNVGIENCDISVASGSAALAHTGHCSNCYSTGFVSGNYGAGGLIAVTNGNITNSYSTCNVNGNAYIGGLVGNAHGELTNCYATGNVASGIGISGGLVGAGNNINSCYALGNVHGGSQLGGIAGCASTNNCFSLGDVIGSGSEIGGLVGFSYGGNMTNSTSYARNVIGTTEVGSFYGNDRAGRSIITGCQCIEIEGLMKIGNGNEAQNAGVEYIDLPFNPKSITLQVGINSNSSSQITFETGFNLGKLSFDVSTVDSARTGLTTADDVLSKVSSKQTDLGAVSNRLDSALDSISVSYDNLVSSRSTLRDADVAEESSRYVQMQILQQASATLLATANQSPSIALQLI